MRSAAAGALFTNDLLWWGFWLDASQCWGNRLRKRYWKSFDSMLGPIKDDIVNGRQVKATASTAHLVDPSDSSSENIARMVSNGTTGLNLSACLGGHLTRLFDLRGRLPEANQMFDKISNLNSYSGNTIISTNAKLGKSERSIKFYQKMLEEPGCSDEFTVIGTMKACGAVSAIKQGRVIHEEIIKCGLEAEGCKLCEELTCRNSISWNAMIAVYSQLGNVSLAVKLFEKMKQESIIPSKITFSSLLKACGYKQGLARGMPFYNQIVICGLDSGVTIKSTLVDMYAKCGRLAVAQRMLDNLPNRNVVLWSATTAVQTQTGNNHLALEFFGRMTEEGVKPHKVLHSSISNLCGSIGAIEQGRLIHDEIKACDLGSDFVMNVKGGRLMDAHDVLKKLKNTTAVLWDALNTGYYQQDNCRMVRQCFEKMQQKCLKPDDQTYTSILAGDHVEGGCHYFKSKIKDKIKPSPEHFNGMASLLGSSGRMKEAHKVLLRLPSPANATFSRSLLTSSEKHGDEEVGEQSLKGTVQSAPDNASSYVLMSNIYAEGDKWAEVKRINDMRIKARAWKKPGRAWVEIKSKVHGFVVGDRTHEESTYIYDKLRKMKRQMNHTGYVPNVELILENRSDSDPFKPNR